MSILPEWLPRIPDGPAQASPDGVHRFDPAPNRNGCGLAAASICLAIATVMVMLRAYSRLFCSRKLGMEDGLGLIGYTTLLGAFISVVLLSQSPGLWVHLWDIRVRDLEPFIKKQFVFDTCYGLTMIFAKAAVLVEWVHIFVPSGRDLFFWACCTVSSMNGLLHVAAMIATWLSCIPQLKIWRPWEAGHCIDGKRLDTTVTVLNLVFNLVILLLPQRAIRKRHIMQMHKLGFALIFSAGTLACVFAAGRVHAAFTLSYDKDASYYSTVPNLLGLAEGTCVLIVFCLGAARRIFSRGKHLNPEKSAESIYRRMEELPLADREAAKVKPNGDFHGIIKTKEFFTHETPNTNDSALFHDQHPWMHEAPKSRPSRWAR